MKSKENLELKHYCENFAEVRPTLEDLGAEKVDDKHQKDYFFNLPAEKQDLGARMKLRIEDGKMSLIYYVRPDFIEGEETSSIVEIIEVDESDLSFLQTVLGVSGIVEKDREIWRKDHTVFHLDTVKGVGQIFEIELQKEGKINKEDQQLFRQYQEKLLPLLGDVIEGSNIDLVLSPGD